MTCAEIKDRTVDYLYGELPESERAAFAAHLTGCEACRAEVAGLEGTLHRARTAVRLLDEPPPARVRVAVLEAARAAAVATAPVAAAAAAMPRRPVDKAKAEAAGGFLEWLRRPWMIPLGVAAAAVALLVVKRESLTNPRAVDEQMRRAAPVSSEPSPVAAQPAAPAAAPIVVPMPNEQPEGPPPAGELRKQEAAPGADRTVAASSARPLSRTASASRKGAVASAPRERRFATPPPPREEGYADKLDADDRLQGALGAGERRDRGAGGVAVGGLYGLKDAKAPADLEKKRAAGPSEKAALPRASATVSAGEAAAPKRVVVPAKPSAHAAPVSPAANAEATVAAAAPAPARLAEPPPPAAPPPAVSARQEASANRRKVAEADSFEAAPAAEAEAGQKAKKEKTSALSPFDEQVQKADRLFTAARWSDAAVAYRELLKRYPTHKSAPVWKGRLRACEQALER
jgi:hypothetical protein